MIGSRIGLLAEQSRLAVIMPAGENSFMSMMNDVVIYMVNLSVVSL